MRKGKKLNSGEEIAKFGTDMTELEGEYTGSREIPTQNGMSILYTIKDNETSEPVEFWGTAVLNRIFRGIEVGAMIGVYYQGKKQGSGGRTYHDYEVYELEVGEEVVEN